MENRWLGAISMEIHEENNPKRPGVLATARIEFTKGKAVAHINEYRLDYTVPGECRGAKRLAFLAVRVFVVCAWGCAVAVCAAVRHGVMDRWAKETGSDAPALEGSGSGLRAV